MSYIIALSGRKGAGKNTVADYIKTWFLKKCNYTSEYDIDISNIGLLESSYIYECSFADTLKEFCIETLGLEHKQCYGSDEDKNTPTKYKWSNVPDFYRWKFGDDPIAKYLVAQGEYTPTEMMSFFHYQLDGGGKNWLEINEKKCYVDPTMLKTGFMTGRDIMQIFGTDLIRQTFGNVWAEATIRRIQKKQKPLSIITDNRFPNEADVVLKQENSLIIRLTRSPSGIEDIHPSESALDGYDWNKPKCVVLDNSNITLEEQNLQINNILNKFITV